jgi:hypothetical protein
MRVDVQGRRRRGSLRLRWPFTSRSWDNVEVKVNVNVEVKGAVKGAVKVKAPVPSMTTSGIEVETTPPPRYAAGWPLMLTLVETVGPLGTGSGIGAGAGAAGSGDGIGGICNTCICCTGAGAGQQQCFLPQPPVTSPSRSNWIDSRAEIVGVVVSCMPAACAADVPRGFTRGVARLAVRRRWGFVTRGLQAG